MRLRLKVQIAVRLRHDIGTLQTQEQRSQADDVDNPSVLRLSIRLCDYTGFLVYV
jgi:hypothetical protein